MVDINAFANTRCIPIYVLMLEEICEGNINRTTFYTVYTSTLYERICRAHRIRINDHDHHHHHRHCYSPLATIISSSRATQPAMHNCNSFQPYKII